MTKPLCPLCEQGFATYGGKHLPSQSLGMIPVTPCLREIFHFRGFVVRPINVDSCGECVVRLPDEQDITVNVAELWLVNDYSMLRETL